MRWSGTSSIIIWDVWWLLSTLVIVVPDHIICTWALISKWNVYLCAETLTSLTEVPWKRSLMCMPRLDGQISQYYVEASSVQAGSASAATDEKRIRKYSDIVSGDDFSLYAIETSGVWGEHALELVTEIGRRKAAMTCDPRSTEFLRQWPSVVVQCGIAWSVLGTFTNNNTGNQLQSRWSVFMCNQY